jgi:two-component system response regulator QseB
MNLLWVENHAPFVHVALRSFLTAHTVTVVPSLAGARAALARDRFDAVLVDFDLDDGKGVELVRELVAATDRPLIVAASAHADGNTALRDAGADAVCGKMEFPRLAALLQELAQRRDGVR